MEACAARMLEDTYKFHVALHDLNDEGNFKWCKDGYSLSFRKDALVNFGPNQPDNSYTTHGENCVELNVLNAPAMHFNDLNCNWPLQFICEVNAKYIFWSKFKHILLRGGFCHLSYFLVSKILNVKLSTSEFQ